MLTIPPVPADCWFLTGPTASGKTQVGIELARRLGTEIISMDSMSLYRGMDIGTAKPTAAEQAIVPHHLVDCHWPWQECSLAEYLGEVHALLKAGTVSFAQAADSEPGAAWTNRPLFVGGTPLYLKALLRGIFEGPPADWELRRSLSEEAMRHGEGHLHRRLASIDPVAASRLHARDIRRIIRAIEVYEVTGTPISHWQRQFEIGRPAAECRVFVLTWPKQQLHERIDARVDAMLDMGLVNEVEQLLRRCFGHHPEVSVHSESAPVEIAAIARQAHRLLSRTASQAVGYREVIEHLAGQQSLASTVELIKLHTRQFAKKQETWFKSLSECRRVHVSAEDRPEAIAQRLLQQLAQ